MAQDPLELALRAFMSREFVDGIINFLEAFDDYESRKGEKHSDKQLLESALTLYKGLAEKVSIDANHQSVNHRPIPSQI